MHEKNGLLYIQLGFGGAVILLPAVGSGQSKALGPGTFNLYCSKGHRLAYSFFI